MHYRLQTLPKQHNLERQFTLRGLSYVGAFAAICLTGWWINAVVPVLTIGLIFITSFVISFGFLLAAKRIHSEWGLSLQLFIDQLFLGGLLYLLGGGIHPLIWLLALPLLFGAIVLPKRFAWGLALSACVIYTGLMFFYQPIGDTHLSSETDFSSHISGMWGGFILTTLLITYFLSHMASTVRTQERELAEIREQAMRDDKLISLGALAAGAAHDLGTPLSTLAILSDDIRADIKDHELDAAEHKLSVINDQVNRCRQVIASITSSAGIEKIQGGQALAMPVFMKQVIEHWRAQRPKLSLKYTPTQISKDAPEIVADKGLENALVNLINNAADASPNDLKVKAQWDHANLTLQILDRGEGFSPEHRQLIGKAPFSNKQAGHGLGLYLSYNIVTRLGGKLDIAPRPGGGTIVNVDLPLDSLNV